MSISNTTSNTTPLPVSADATDAAPLQISDEAREAGRNERVLHYATTGYHVQLAINSATEKLQMENEEYIERLCSLFTKDSANQTKQRNQLRAELLATQAANVQLREALQYLWQNNTREWSRETIAQMDNALALTSATALAPIVEALKTALNGFEYLSDRINTTAYVNDVKHALQLLGVKKEK